MIVRTAPTGTAASVHGNGVVQAPVFETKVRPLGVGSLTVTSRASEGPALLTLSV